MEGPRTPLGQAGSSRPACTGLEPGDLPTLHFLHLLLPHAPWRYLPSGNEYNFRTYGAVFPSDRLPGAVIELAHRQHLLQVAYTDRLVGKVIDKLKAEGMWDRSLVVMEAYHGTPWTPGEPSRALGRTNAPDLMWVPQFIKAPNQDNGVVDDRNWNGRPPPTVADLAGVRSPGMSCGASQTRPAPVPRSGGTTRAAARVRDGPANFSQAPPDTLVRGSEGVRGLTGPRRRPRLPRPGLSA